MASNSIRVAEELFVKARDEGALMSRSAAQQLEHWARLGAALEGSGMTINRISQLLGRRSDARQEDEDTGSTLWAFKRERQRIDLESMHARRVSPADLSWFSKGATRSLKLVDSPY